MSRRPDDARPDELLAEAGRTAARLGLAVGWTDGVVGGQVKEVSGTGRAAWKHAAVLSDVEYAAGFYVKRCRARNPVTVASRSNLLLVEVDLDVPDDAYRSDEEVETRVAALLEHLGVALPKTVTVRSRRGLHLYFRLEDGCSPVKVQIDEKTGIAPTKDGYVVGVPGLHELPGVVYRYLRDDALATCPPATHTRLAERGEETREKAWAEVKAGVPIAKGWRNETVFHAALELVREGKPRRQILERLLEVNREQCDPPLAEERVRKQLDGAVTYARRNPTVDEELRAKAREVLRDRGSASERTPPEPAAVAVGWEEPVPIATRDAMPTLDIGLLPNWLAEWTRQISAEKGAALDLGATLGLGAVSGGIARCVQVSPRPGWFEPVNLYAIVALPPGQSKSPVFKSALRPVRTLERQRMQDWRENERLATLTAAIFEKRKKDLVTEAALDLELDPERLQEMMAELDAGLGPIEAAEPPRLLTEDVTPEGLASLLAAHGRIIAASDEGSALFENLAGRYARGSVSWDLFNKAHSGVDIAIDRKSSGAVIVFDPSLTLVLATQPEMLRTLAGKPGAGGRGVLARPLYALPAPVHADGVTPAADPDVLAEYERRIRGVYSDTPELETDEEGHPRPVMLKLDAPARALFEDFEAEVNRERRDLAGEDVESESVYLGWLSKLCGQTARIAAVLHCAENWTGSNGTAALSIDDGTVERAIALARYYRTHALSVFGLMGELPMQALAVRILRWVSARSEDELATLTVRDVHRSRGAGTTAAQVRVALRLLEEHGFVRLEQSRPGRSGGRPSERVHVNPRSRNLPNSGDRGDETQVLSPMSPRSGEFSFCTEHPHAGSWLARDQVWRCRECEPPAFPGEVLAELRP